MLHWEFEETSIRETSTGGKAGKGHNRTTSFMVQDRYFTKKLRVEGRTASKYIPFRLGDRESRLDALCRALQWCGEVDKQAKGIVEHGKLVGWWRYQGSEASV